MRFSHTTLEQENRSVETHMPEDVEQYMQENPIHALVIRQIYREADTDRPDAMQRLMDGQMGAQEYDRLKMEAFHHDADTLHPDRHNLTVFCPLQQLFRGVKGRIRQLCAK